MSKKQPLKSSLITLLIAIVAILGTFYVLKPHKEAQDEAKEQASLLFPELNREQVFEVSVTSNDLNIKLTRSAENQNEWFLDANEDKYRADKNSVDGMISSILASKEETVVENIQEEQVGLKPPKFAITIPGEKKSSKTLLLGNDTPVDYLVYAKWSDSPVVFTTSRSLRFAVDKKVNDLRNKKVLFALKPESLRQIQIQSFGRENLSRQRLSFTKEDSSWTHTKGYQLDSKAINNWIQNLSAISVKSFLTEDKKFYSKYGLNRPVAKLEYKFENGETEDWVLGKFKEGDQEKWAFSSSNIDTIFELSPSFIDNFKIDLFKFREKKIVSFDKEKVKSLSITEPDSDTVEFVKENNSWSLKSADKKTPAKTEVVENTLRTLTELRADKFHDSSSSKSLGLNKPQRLVNIEFSGDDKPLTISFGKSLSKDEVVAKSSQSSSPASVGIELDKTLSTKRANYVNEGSEQKSQKGEKIKMESTVSDLKDLKKLSAPIVKEGYQYSARMELQDGKVFEIEFEASKAPYTVSNFLHLARNGFYNNVKFHRVIEDFVAQGGDPTGTGTGGPGWKFEDEQNDLTHQRGVLSMANAGPNTNGSQFFVVLQPQPHLNGKHTVFGKITSGLDQIDNIKVGDVMKNVEVFEKAL